MTMTAQYGTAAAQIAVWLEAANHKQAYGDLPSGAGAGPPKPMGNPGGFQMQSSAPSNGFPSFAGATRTLASTTLLHTIKSMSTHSMNLALRP